MLELLGKGFERKNAYVNQLDILRVVECCLKSEDDKALVGMEGYDLLVEDGINMKRRAAARVVVYIKSSLAYQEVHVIILLILLIYQDIIPEVWLKAGHKGHSMSKVREKRSTSKSGFFFNEM